MKVQLQLQLLHIYHIVIQAQLKYSIGAKVLSLRKCGTSQKSAGLVQFCVLMSQNTLQWIQSSSNPDSEPNRQLATIANTMYTYWGGACSISVLCLLSVSPGSAGGISGGGGAGCG